MRILVLILLPLVSLFVFVKGTTSSTFPEKNWVRAEPEELGWSTTALEAFRSKYLQNRSEIVFVAVNGKILFSHGAVERPEEAYSIRKGILSALWGAVLKGRDINLQQKLGDLGISDSSPLSPSEQQATILDLLKMRSGVYLPSVDEFMTWRAFRPKRGIHVAGTHWVQNDWDVNVAEFLLERFTDEPLLDIFLKKLAPLELNDVRNTDIYFKHGKESLYPAFQFRLSARDLARIGHLYLRKGNWGTEQVFSNQWFVDSTMPYSQTIDIGQQGRFGYLLWVDTQWRNTSIHALNRLFGYEFRNLMMSGMGGKYVVVIPEFDMVYVQTSSIENQSLTNWSGQKVVADLLQELLDARLGLTSPPTEWKKFSGFELRNIAKYLASKI